MENADDIGIAPLSRPDTPHRAEAAWLTVPGGVLHAWRVLPASDPPWPAVVLSHGWGAVKEMNLDYVAAALADVGIASIVFDHRGFGASPGVRGDLDPEVQIQDYREVLSIAADTDGIDADRLGVWGTSYSGGHVLCVAARDARVRAAVAQVPTISGSENLRRRHRGEALERLQRRLERERTEVAAGRAHTYTRLLPELPGPVSTETTELAPPPVELAELTAAPESAYDDDRAHLFYTDLGMPRLRTWENRSTLMSVARYARYEPGLSMGEIAPRPLLVIIAEQDTITPADLAEAAASRSGETVEVLRVPGGHYNPYAAARAHCTKAAAAFFARHLA